MKGRYELTLGGRLGPGVQDCKEATVLTRVVRWTNDGIEYEADPRQVEMIMESLGYDDSTNPVVTPGLKPLREQLEGDKPLPQGEHT